MKNISILLLIIFLYGCSSTSTRDEQILRHNLYNNGNVNIPRDDPHIVNTLIMGGAVSLGVLGIVYNNHGRGYHGHSNSGWKHNKPKYKPIRESR